MELPDSDTKPTLLITIRNGIFQDIVINGEIICNVIVKDSIGKHSKARYVEPILYEGLSVQELAQDNISIGRAEILTDGSRTKGRRQTDFK